MLTIKVITENQDEVIRRLAVKHYDAKEITDKIIAADKIRRNAQTTLDANLTDFKNDRFADERRKNG